MREAFYIPISWTTSELSSPGSPGQELPACCSVTDVMDEISDETQSGDDTSVCCIVISSGVRVESSAISRILPPTSDIDVITNLSMYNH